MMCLFAVLPFLTLLFLTTAPPAVTAAPADTIERGASRLNILIQRACPAACATNCPDCCANPFTCRDLCCHSYICHFVQERRCCVSMSMSWVTAFVLVIII
ncbi:hypothetical protein K490DRAFT_54889 [Saccharata proteae CBS 121410]|uniref:Agouti domain-containing protein n=1 Tax=Saccharata proteae CBS 121410 TaxID=1314787 RepID=A0A6A5YCM8_9PEZI|nr:hypothetical protein K490DRAFT_54889 [Saccharata proteae CBS 121410]